MYCIGTPGQTVEKNQVFIFNVGMYYLPTVYTIKYFISFPILIFNF